MPSPGDSCCLIMLTGASAGCGKSTITRALAERYRSLGHEVMDIDEDAVWGDRVFDSAQVDYTTASPLFYDLLHKGRHTGHPASPGTVVEAFEELMAEAVERGGVWLQDWTWPDLLGMVGWSSQIVGEVSQQLRDISAPVSPRVLYLRTDPRRALQRALQQRGPVWFNRHVGRALHAPVTPDVVSDMAARCRDEEPERLRALAGWPTTFVQAEGSTSEVLDVVWQQLHQPMPAAPAATSTG